MTPYSVTWEPDAEDALAEAYLTSDDREAVVAASAEADAQLAEDPYLLATRLSEGLLKVHIRPLVVFFSVDESTSVVTVSGVGLIP